MSLHAVWMEVSRITRSRSFVLIIDNLLRVWESVSFLMLSGWKLAILLVLVWGRMGWLCFWSVENKDSAAVGELGTSRCAAATSTLR
jgi:hypothetical protein